MSTTLDGAGPTTVRRAIETGDPLPGTYGFAGHIDGCLVRDVLGRKPVYFDAEQPTEWALRPTDLATPRLVPAGSLRNGETTQRVWRLPDPTVSGGPDAIERLRGTLADCIDAKDGDDIAVGFSGGVDSGAIAARLQSPCFVGSVDGGRDLAAARQAADCLRVDLEIVIITPSAIEGAVPRVAEAINSIDPMDLGIAIPLFLVAERAAERGFERLAVGQGVDELFGGYEKVERAASDDRVAAETVLGAREEVLETLPRQLARDVCTIRAGGLEPELPLLHDEVVRVARTLDPSLLVDGRGTRKVAFRLAVREWVPHRIAFRSKIAIQYGSLVSRELDRLARQAGFKRRMDHHVERYIRSLL